MNRLALPAILATALSMISGPASSGAPAAIARAALVRADIAPAGTATIRLRRGMKRGCRAQPEDGDNAEYAASPHSITSFARTSTDCGIPASFCPWTKWQGRST